MAKKYENIGKFRYAGLAYLEYIYAGLSQSFLFEIPEPGNALFSNEQAKLWLSVAENMNRTKNVNNAIGYLLRSVVFGDGEDEEYCIDLAVEWGNRATSEDVVQIDSLEKTKILESIIESYVKLNMHPRAWTLVDEFANEITNPKELKNRITEDWLKIVEESKRGRTKVVLYNQEVWPNGDPLSVTIPWPCSDDAIAKVQEILKNEIDNEFISE